MNAIFLTPIAAVRYAGWGQPDKSSLEIIRGLYQGKVSGQWRRGVAATVTRDVVFGAFFAGMRFFNRQTQDGKERNAWTKGALDFSSAAAATVFSAPFNYVRNMQFNCPIERRAPKMGDVLSMLIRDSKHSARPLRFLQSRLRLGWGTGRVASGMALSSFMYEKCTELSGTAERHAAESLDSDEKLYRRKHVRIKKVKPKNSDKSIP